MCARRLNSPALAAGLSFAATSKETVYGEKEKGEKRRQEKEEEEIK
jgi:hypothetical protein